MADTGADQLAFLTGGGALGRLIAGLDWSATSLGPITDWPRSLRAATGLILGSPIAMVLLWGEDGVMLYNEAYARFAGQRHPELLGIRAVDGWPEVADFNLHVIRTCLAGGSLSFKDQRLTLFRRHLAEEVWMDLAYSPVLDDEGRPAGALAVVVDTTERNIADERLRIAQEAGRFGAFEWYPRARRLIVSDTFRALYGLGPDEDVTDDVLLALVLPEDRAQTGSQQFERQGNPLSYSEYRIRPRGGGDIRWIARRGEILDGATAGTQRFLGVAWDITERKQAEQADAFLATLSDRLRDLADAGEVVAVASEMLGRHLGAGRVGYGEVVANGADFVVERDWTDGAMASFVGQHDMAKFGAPIIDGFRAGRTLRVDDILNDPRTSAPGVAEAFAGITMRSGIAVPLIREGRFAGCLYAHCPHPRAWRDDEEAIAQAVAARVWDAAQRAQAEQRLRQSEEIFRLLAQAIPNLVWSADPAGRPTWFNDRVYAYSGARPGELDGQGWTALVHPDDRAAALAAWRAAERDVSAYETQYRLRRADGDYRWHIARGLPIRAADGRVTRWIGTSTDIEDQRRALTELARLNATLEERVEERSERLRQTEEALRQSQKMEAIGQLTGGIAHDFNNMLTGILGSLELVRRRIATGRIGDLDRFMDAATTSAQRAAALTHRLLAFARRQSLDTKPVRVDALVADMADLLRRTLGEQITLSIDAAPDTWPALTDPHQLESAILNLAINARDAMPDGGRLVIGIANVDRGQLDQPEECVAVSVADTGDGMSREVVERAFEPFFTTKPAGQGTGLGLSMVYGFTRQSGGQARIDSAPGAGTTVTLFLPRARSEAQTPQPPPPDRAPPGAGETVLVVEDDPSVRMLVLEVLGDLGYRALQAADATEALPILQSPQPIDLLVSDVGLPGMSGRQLADQAQTLRPGLKVLLITGYAANATIRGFFLADGMAMITKPFAIEALAAKVSEMMA